MQITSELAALLSELGVWQQQASDSAPVQIERRSRNPAVPPLHPWL